MIENTETKTRDIPVWLTGLILILCVGGGSYLVWQSLRDQPPQVVEIPPDKLAAANLGGRSLRGGDGALAGGGPRNLAPVVNRDADGVHQLRGNSYRAKIGNTVMTVNASSAGRFDMNPGYATPVRSAEEAELGVLRMSVIQDANWQQTLNVTPQQVAALRKVPPQLNMRIEPADRTRLTDLWKAYRDAGASEKPAAEKAVLAALDEIGKKNLQATKDYEAARAKAIRDVFTPEQIKAYREGTNSKPAAPAATPATPAPAAVAK
jgi:hypothetical protein